MIFGEQAKISVIVPIYNAQLYLERCINSILNQTYANLELILVDDGSTDRSREKIEYFVKHDSRVRAFYKENGGPNSARKLGVLHAEGHYVMFVDADDCIDRDFCEKLMAICKENSVEIVGCGLKKEQSGGVLKRMCLHKVGIMQGKEAALNLLDRNEFYKSNFCTSLIGYLFDISLLKNVLMDFDERITYSEDVICLFLLLWDARKIYILEEYLYTIVLVKNSLTRNHAKRYYLSQKALYQYGLKEFRKRQMPREMFVNLEQLIIRDLLIAGYAEAFGHLDYLFPFAGVERNASIVLYGAGAFGIEVFKYIQDSTHYRLIAWVDRNYKELETSEGKVENPTVLATLVYYYVVVAVTNKKIAEQIVKKLLDMKIPRKKIKTISQALISYEALPKSFFEEE